MHGLLDVVGFLGFCAAAVGSSTAPYFAFPWAGRLPPPRSYWPALQARSAIPSLVAAAGFIAMAALRGPGSFGVTSVLAGLMIMAGLRIPRTAREPRLRAVTGRYAVPWRSPWPGFTPRITVLGLGYAVGWGGFLAAVAVTVPNAA